MDQPASALASPPVAVRDLHRRYRRGAVALDGVSLQLQPGELFGLVGPDGVGKSTLMMIVAGVMPFKEGSVEVLGHEFRHPREAEAVKDRIGFLPQGLGLNLYRELTVEENIDFFAALRRVPRERREKRKERLLAMTRLTPFRNRLMVNLSGGMQQKLGLCCTLIHTPEVLILDEPTTGVDPLSRRDFWEIITEIRRTEGTTALVSTAYLDEAERFDRVALMNRGRIVALGEPQRLEDRAGVADMESLYLAQVGYGEAPPPQPHPQRIRQQEAVVEAHGLVRRYDSFTAIDNVSLSLRRGEVVGLVGPNGSGKTTLIKMLCGILQPSEGTATVAGERVATAGPRVRTRIGYMSQRFSLYRDLTARENMRLYGRIYRVPRQQLTARMRQLIDLLGLESQQQALSGDVPLGVRQRIALGCALIHRPQVVFLDEPTSGVDPAARRDFWRLIQDRAAEERIAVLVSTHYLSEAEVCDRILLLHRGRVLTEGPPARLKEEFSRHAGTILEVYTPDFDRLLPRLQAVYPGAALMGRRIRLPAPHPAEDREQIAHIAHEAQAHVEAIEREEPTLEDVFIYHIGQEESEDSAR